MELTNQLQTRDDYLRQLQAEYEHVHEAVGERDRASLNQCKIELVTTQAAVAALETERDRLLAERDKAQAASITEVRGRERALLECQKQLQAETAVRRRLEASILESERERDLSDRERERAAEKREREEADRLRDMERELQETTIRRGQLEDEVEDANRVCNGLRKDLQALAAQLEAKERQRQQDAATHAEREAEHAQAEKGYRKEARQRDQAIDAAQRDSASCRAQLDRLKEELRRERDREQERLHAVEGVVKDKAAAQSVLDGVRKQERQLKHQLEQALLEGERQVQQTVSQYEAKLHKTRASLEKARLAGQVSSDELSASTQQVDMLRQQLGRMSAALALEKKEVDRLRQETVSLVDQVQAADKMRMVIQDMKHHLQASTEDLQTCEQARAQCLIELEQARESETEARRTAQEWERKAAQEQVTSSNAVQVLHRAQQRMEQLNTDADLRVSMVERKCQDRVSKAEQETNRLRMELHSYRSAEARAKDSQRVALAVRVGTAGLRGREDHKRERERDGYHAPSRSLSVSAEPYRGREREREMAAERQPSDFDRLTSKLREAGDEIRRNMR
ncbi:hypothetical protein KIPB_001468 [Kipferlia bialata]|uniref:Uncharacterized protein n=1 Tax=Kipferlia bialata TaxID=797122 RepID=A0A9K3GF77_9EUKA|nr:hypothetical protein KIPB_001468 [Kipferlia bialata]|eukprot:g1468.t1